MQNPINDHTSIGAYGWSSSIFAGSNPAGVQCNSGSVGPLKLVWPFLQYIDWVGTGSSSYFLHTRTSFVSRYTDVHSALPLFIPYSSSQNSGCNCGTL